MIAKTIVASAVIGGALALFAAPTPAQAISPANVQIDKQASGVTQVARRGGGGMRGMRGGGMRGMRGPRVGGPRVRGYRGYRGRGVRPGKRYRGPRYYGKRRYYKGRRRYYGLPYVGYGYYPYYYGGSCEWLRRKAYQTGSAYWWRRYRACRAYY